MKDFVFNENEDFNGEVGTKNEVNAEILVYVY